MCETTLSLPPFVIGGADEVRLKLHNAITLALAKFGAFGCSHQQASSYAEGPSTPMGRLVRARMLSMSMRQAFISNGIPAALPMQN
jgi:hypothetical protein